MGDSAYSFSLTTFSRTGKLLQIEYALNAVANGRTSLGIAAKDGVVIATDKKLASSLVDTAQVSKVESVGETAGGGSGMVYSGVGPDYRVLGEFFATRLASVLVYSLECFMALGSWMYDACYYCFHRSVLERSGTKTDLELSSYLDCAAHISSFRVGGGRLILS